MGKTANKVIEIALNEVGYLEKKSNSQLDSKTANAGSGNFTKYARDLDAITGFYNGKKQGYPWCDVFVDYCFVKAFGVEAAKALLNQPNKSCGAGCGYSASYFKAKGQFFKSQPQPGDQIFFLDSAGDVCHTGLVYKVDNLFVYTVEGNTSSQNGVIANGGGVFKKSYSLGYSRIYGYGRPAYDAEKKEESKDEAVTVKAVKAIDPAKSFLKSLAGTYKVTANSGLNVRHGAGITKKKMVAIPKGTKVNCYGYYTSVLGTKWLYIQFTYKNVTYTGFASSKYLQK